MVKKFKPVIVISFLALVLTLASCPEPARAVFPDTFNLQFTVENKMDTPITVKIRNYYCWGRGNLNPVISYSDWACITLESLETKPLGNGEEGFTLLNHTLGTTVATELITSFEIKVETPGKTISLAGYRTEDPRFDGTGLCFLELTNAFEVLANAAILYTEKQEVQFERDYVLPVKLTFNGDGTYLFDDELVEDGDKIHIYKPR